MPPSQSFKLAQPHSPEAGALDFRRPERPFPATSAAMTFRRVMFPVAILMTCGMIMAMHEADPDLWGHVQYGREILQTGELPRTTTWSFVAVGHRWINHENLAEMLMAWSFDRFGIWGLTLGKYLLGLSVIGLGYWSGRRTGVHPLLLGAMCLVTALSLEFHWHFRPQVFGYAFFAIVVWLLRQCLIEPAPDANQKAERWSRFATFGLIPIMMLWTNTHGSFAAGLAVVFAVLGCESARILAAEWLNWFPSAACADSSASPRQAATRLAAIAVMTLLATFLNPYGPGLHLWLAEDVYLPRPEIGDWQPLALFSGDRESLCFWVIAATTALAVWQGQRRQWALIVVTVLLCWQALSHVRHLALLSIVWLMWFPVPLEQLRRRIAIEWGCSESGSGTTATWFREAVAMALLTGWILGVGIRTWPKVSTIAVDGTRYPVDAFAFMAKHRLEGKTLATFNWAQYAIGFFADAGLDSTVAVDGRLRTCYPQEAIDRHFDFLFGKEYQGPRYRSPRSGPVDPLAALVVDRPDYVLISRKQKPSVRTMESLSGDWQLIYQDGLSQLWRRNEIRADVAALDSGDAIPTPQAMFPGFPELSSPGDGPLLTTRK